MKNKIKQYISSIVESHLVEVKAKLNEYKIMLDQLNINIQQNQSKIDTLKEKVQQYDDFFASIKTESEKIPFYKENLRNINTSLSKYEGDYLAIKARMDDFEKAMIHFENRTLENTLVTSRDDKSYANKSKEISTLKEKNECNTNDYNIIDYLDFENEFRGSTHLISQRQRQYVTYFKGKKNVIDIGCGRGEFLELMKKEEINTIGVDTYQDFVSLCKIKGFQVINSDGIEYLSNCDAVDGIFLGQVVEHLKLDQIIRLCNLAYQKLEEGGAIVIETPNPKSLSTFANSFYMDPSHEKPVHPYSLKYYLKKAGFSDIKIIYTEESKEPGIVTLLDSSASNIDEFNASLKRVSDVLFGSQDYAVIAIK